jgi:hypothetical protein
LGSAPLTETQISPTDPSPVFQETVVFPSPAGIGLGEAEMVAEEAAGLAASGAVETALLLGLQLGKNNTIAAASTAGRLTSATWRMRRFFIRYRSPLVPSVSMKFDKMAHRRAVSQFRVHREWNKRSPISAFFFGPQRDLRGFAGLPGPFQDDVGRALSRNAWQRF